jgi:hypothetical protein
VAEKVAVEAGLEVRVLGPEEIQELGMGAYWAVAKGSANEPRFIELVYRPEEVPTRKVALVGKGLTFDTGGYSIKPPESMKTMKGDMAGAAAVIGAMKAIAALKPPVEVRAYVAAAENMISGHAYRVNDVIRAAQAAQPAPAGVRILYATQGATDPPTFTLFANREVPRTWLRYLERRLREDLNLGSTPIKLRVRRRSE